METRTSRLLYNMCGRGMSGVIRKIGFEPVFATDSKILILGSFPSVKSREIDFYYGNKQNRFWKMLCGYFGKQIPDSVEEKRDFLLRYKVALWDVVISCEIEGSADSDVKNAEIVDLSLVLDKAPIEKILLNGMLAYELFRKEYAELAIPYEKMPSTSPANPRYNEEVWRRALDDVFTVS